MSNPGIRTERELSVMREIGAVHAAVLAGVREIAKPGVSTLDLDTRAREICKEHGVNPTQVGYSGFPAALCTGVNDDGVHCIPSEKVILQDGDILTIDTVLDKDGLHVDGGMTIPIGTVNKKGLRLIAVTERALHAGIRAAIAGNQVRDISTAIYGVVKKAGFDVLRDFIGHGIGYDMHEAPDIPNFPRPGTSVVLQEGMTLALDTMVTEGKGMLRTLDDLWSTKTIDGKRFAFFEHTIRVGRQKAEILTVPKN